jgi:hypothetical protein
VRAARSRRRMGNPRANQPTDFGRRRRRRGRQMIVFTPRTRSAGPARMAIIFYARLRPRYVYKYTYTYNTYYTVYRGRRLLLLLYYYCYACAPELHITASVWARAYRVHRARSCSAVYLRLENDFRVPSLLIVYHDNNYSCNII